jgi:sugar O-acyltransferase (sialic acid O-acetyltransferase NeuD family)
MTREPIVIVGAGGFGREVLQILRAGDGPEQTYDVRGFIDDGSPDEGLLAGHHVPLLGDVDALASLGLRYAMGIGDSAPRRSACERLAELAVNPIPPLVHPSAVVGENVTLGLGSIVCGGVQVTCDVHIGKYAILNLNSTIGHDVRMGDYCTVNPGASVSGHVTLGEGVTLGTGAVVNDERSIGDWTTVGSGAAVVRDLPPGVTAVGIPAKPLPR